ncbi:MAG: hypothetical protein ACODAQ_01335 [Phycisphaeraceae bacterium]
MAVLICWTSCAVPAGDQTAGAAERPTAPDQVHESAPRIHLLEEYDSSIGVRTGRRLAHIHQPGSAPHNVVVVVPDAGEFTASSRRTTLWLTEGHVVDVMILPLEEAVEWKQAVEVLQALIERWGVEPGADMRKDLEKWKTWDLAGREKVFNPPRQRTRTELSAKVHLLAHVRPAPKRGWFLAIDFSANPEERRRLRREREEAVRQEAEQRLAVEVFENARTAEERFARVDAFLDDPPTWFTDPPDRDTWEYVRAVKAILAERAVADAGIAGIERLIQARINWLDAAEAHPAVLAAYLNGLEPDQVIEGTWLYRALARYANRSEAVMALLESWLAEAQKPAEQEKWVEAIWQAARFGKPRAIRMVQLLEDERASVRLAAAKRLPDVGLMIPRWVLEALEAHVQARREAGADAEELEPLEAILEELRRGRITDRPRPKS